MEQNTAQKKPSFIASALNALPIVYPVFVLALVLFPMLIGVFINYELVDVRQIIILLVWIPILTIPFFFFRAKVFYYIITLLCFINGFVNLGSWIMIKHPVTASSMFVLFNTTYEEAAGFSALKGGFAYLLFIPYLFLLFLALRYPPKTKVSIHKNHYYLAGGLLLCIVAFISENTMKERFVRLGTPVLFKSVFSFNQEVKSYRQLKEKLNFQVRQLDATAFSSKKNQVTVLILGESTNRNHMSLYNKDLHPTNPLLSKHKDLIVYTDVVSGYSHTLQSVPNSLSASNLENGLRPGGETVTVTEVYQSAGYKTYWLSNQSPIGVWDNMITLFAQQYNEVKFLNNIGSSSKETLQKRSYDGKLFQPFIQVLEEEEKKKFIVLHLIGTHTSYASRYPKEFEHFTDFSTRKNRTISEYQNAVLYNDYVVDSLFKIIRDYCVKTGTIGNAIYISDHGENVYDFGDYVGHDYVEKMPKSLIEIPFLVWLSPKYNTTFPQKSKAIKENYKLPYVTDDLFHSLIDISGIKASIFNPQRSVFNKQFNAKRKRLLIDGYDYDDDEAIN